MTAIDPTALALLRAILSDPRDDTPRLVYADWLDENGEPDRAEFIRVQCAIPEAEADVCPSHPKYAAELQGRLDDLRRRERELVDGIMGMGVEILPVVAGLTRTNLAPGGYGWYARDDPGAAVDATFSRGFVSAVTCPAAVWLRHHESLFWHPWQERCPGCQGTGGRVYTGSVWDRFTCRICDGTGRTSRQIPPTAQPIERVTLTTDPRGVPGWPWSEGATYSHRGDTLTCHRWPDLVFALPGTRPA